jgi:hypothetical protein
MGADGRGEGAARRHPDRMSVVRARRTTRKTTKGSDPTSLSYPLPLTGTELIEFICTGYRAMDQRRAITTLLCA